MKGPSSALLVAALSASVLSTSPAAAQTSLLFQGGVTRSSFTGDDVPGSFEATDGLAFGASIGFPLTQMISIMPGLYWVEKGAQVGLGLGSELEFQLSYVEIPLLFAFDLTDDSEGLGLSLFVGPEIAFETGCQVEFEPLEGIGGVDVDGISTDCDDGDTDDDLVSRRGLDFGMIFGGGLSYPLGRSLRATLNGGLDLGLRSIDDSFIGADVKNSAYFLQLGVALPLGRGRR